MVTGEGKITLAKASTTLLSGIVGGVGLLGVVTEVTFKAVPRTKTRLSVFPYADDADLVENVNKLRTNKAYDGVFVSWRPDSRMYTVHATETVAWDTPSVPADAAFGPFNILTAGAPPTFIDMITSTIATWNQPGGAVTANALISTFGQQLLSIPWTAYTDKKGNTMPLDHAKFPVVVGETADIATSVPCAENSNNAAGNTCLWSRTAASDGLAIWGTEVAVVDTQETFASVVADIRKVISQDLNPAAAGKSGMGALLPVGDIIFRWGARASMILGGARQGPIMYVETQGLTNARPPNNNQFPIRNMFALDIIEQVLLCKYKGIPHFGKNFVRTFSHPACTLKITMQQQLAEFKQLQAHHDPLLLFEPQLFTRFLKGSSIRLIAGCDVRRECFCTSDLHCAIGFKCVRSSAFPEYKVCKPPANYDAVGT